MYSWAVHWSDFRAAVFSVLDCGGDSDTAGAIVGAIAGASTTSSGIPDVWTDSLMEWPGSSGVIKAIAQRLSQQQLASEFHGRSGIFGRHCLFETSSFWWSSLGMDSDDFYRRIKAHGSCPSVMSSWCASVMF